METSFWVVIFFSETEIVSSEVMEICQICAWAGSCHPVVEFWTFSWEGTLTFSVGWEISSLEAVWAPTQGPRSPPVRQSDHRPCDGARS